MQIATPLMPKEEASQLVNQSRCLRQGVLRTKLAQPNLLPGTVEASALIPRRCSSTLMKLWSAQQKVSSPPCSCMCHVLTNSSTHLTPKAWGRNGRMMSNWHRGP